MRELLILAVSAFFLALILTPLCRNLFRRLGVVDQPDRERKLHERPVPHMGGVPIVLAYLASFFLLTHFAKGDGVNLSLLFRVAPAAAMIFAIGVLDDWLGLEPLEKLGVQIIAGGFAFTLGVRISGLANYELSPWLSVPVTIIWLIACTNAFNLIDGVDGLAAGVGLFATATTLIAALMQHNLPLAFATAPLAGALIGFLRYNFNPATIFLGDSGSLTVGFLLGCFGVLWSQKSATILGMTAPLMALSIPILDVCLSVVRRFLRRQPIMGGDRGHIHHRLLDRGLSLRRVVLLLYGMCGLAAVFSLFQSMAVNHYSAAVILVFCAVAWVGIQNLGYDEFNQARRMILAGGFREALNSQLALRAFQESLATAGTIEKRWELLQEAGRQFAFSEVRWRTEGTVYYALTGNEYHETDWHLRISLGGGDYVNFTWANAAGATVLNVGALVDVVRNGLSAQTESAPTEDAQLAVAAGAAGNSRGTTAAKRW
jgi:UDP-GlcNAc:undecaprenyl-phosphate GlcNAc-1-phosphate transferase